MYSETSYLVQELCL